LIRTAIRVFYIYNNQICRVNHPLVTLDDRQSWGDVLKRRIYNAIIKPLTFDVRYFLLMACGHIGCDICSAASGVGKAKCVADMGGSRIEIPISAAIEYGFFIVIDVFENGL